MSHEDFFENSSAAFVRIALADGKILLANRKSRSIFNSPDSPFNVGESVLEITENNAVNWRSVMDFFKAQDTEKMLNIPFQVGSEDTKRLSFNGTVCEAGVNLDLVVTELVPHPLEVAADHLSEAISIYDKDDKRIYANSRFFEQNTELGETSRLGTTFEAYIRSLVKSGKIAEIEDDGDTWLQERLLRHQHPEGEFIIDRGEHGWMQVDEKRLPDGSTVILSSDITSLKENEIIVGETAARFRRIMSYSPIGAMTVSTDGQYRYVNEIGANGFGLTREEMEGRRSHDFYANPEDRNKIIAEVNKNGFVTDRQTLLKRVDGTTFWALISVYFDPDNANQYIAWYHNVDELLRAHRNLVELTAAIEAMSEPVAVFDEDDHFAFTNKAFRKEASEAGFIPKPGRPFVDHITIAAYSGSIRDADGREEKWIAERLRHHRSPAGPFEIAHINGKVFQGVEKKLPSGGGVLLLTDITDVKNTSNELALAKDKAEIADRAKSEFLATISHELRTPLTSIKGSLGLLTGVMAEEFSDDANSLLEMAKRNSDTLLGLINDLLDFEKILTGNMILNTGQHDVAGVVIDLIQTIGGYAETLHVELVCETPSEPAMAEIDRPRFEQVLRNLVSNAAKFSNKGDRVKICVENNDKRVRVNVIDQGIGIPKKEIDRIFERFTQVDSTDMRSRNGTGLGLPISKALVVGMGGVIGCHSVEGEGSTFYVEFERNA